jgi:hypothetical protein
LYVEQTQREREQAVTMHSSFQRDLCKLRLETARAYVKTLTDVQMVSSYLKIEVLCYYCTYGRGLFSLKLLLLYILL